MGVECSSVIVLVEIYKASQAAQVLPSSTEAPSHVPRDPSREKADRGDPLGDDRANECANYCFKMPFNSKI